MKCLMEGWIDVRQHKILESYPQELPWGQEAQALRHDRVDRPGQADRVVQGNHCHPSLLSH